MLCTLLGQRLKFQINYTLVDHFHQHSIAPVNSFRSQNTEIGVSLFWFQLYIKTDADKPCQLHSLDRFYAVVASLNV